MRLPTLFRDPLVHFLVAGGLLFGLYRVMHGPQAAQPQEARTILVDQPSLLRFMQYESMAFKPDYFRKTLASLPADQERELIERYVREEALFREASAMGLAEGDYVIRRRLVQKMLYLLDDTATESFAPTMPRCWATCMPTRIATARPRRSRSLRSSSTMRSCGRREARGPRSGSNGSWKRTTWGSTRPRATGIALPICRITSGARRLSSRISSARTSPHT